MSWRLDPRQLLWVCPEKPADALWAAEQILRNGSCGALLCWLPQVRPESLRRLHLAAQASDLLFVALRPSAAAAHATPAPCGWRWRPRRADCPSISSSAGGLPAIRRCTWAWSPAPSKHPPAMRLWIAACLRCLPLDAIRPHWPDDAQAYAVLEQERVIALTPAARLAGVRLDMRRAGAAAIAPQVELLPRSPQAEADALQGAALALLQYTPEVALADEATVLLGVGASLQFFRGPRALARRVAATLRALDLRVSLGMAPTAAGAWLLAQRRERRACRRVLTLPTLVRRLDALPLALLPRRGRAWTGCRTSAAPRWATCAPCRAPACSGAARPNCWRRWTPPMAWRPSRNAGSSRRRASPAASS